MLTWRERAEAALYWLWEAWGDGRNKNRLILVLLLMCAFGMLDPDRATQFRDLVIGMAF